MKISSNIPVLVRISGSCLLAVCAAWAAVSCGKTDTPEQPSDTGDCIAFYVSANNTIGTKAAIDDTESLLAMSQVPSIHVTDQEQNTAFGVNKEIIYSDNGVWRSDKEWVSGRSYQFYAYISSPDSGYEAPVSVSDNGRNVTVTQPEKYSDNNDHWSDYFLSYITNADGDTRGLVSLDFERVTTCVELYVSTPNSETVTIENVEFTNVNRSATFRITKHANSGDAVSGQMNNSWSVTPGSSRTSYSVSDVVVKQFSAGQDFDYNTDYRVMYFLTVPQETHVEEPGNVYDICLNMTYTVKESDTSTPEYTVKLPLNNYRPAMWEMGHKIRYYVSIDTSVELTGTVSAWKTVDFIEGTLLPD